MTINWVRLGLCFFTLLLALASPNGVSLEMTRLFKLLCFLFSILMLGLSFEVKEAK